MSLLAVAHRDHFVTVGVEERHLVHIRRTRPSLLVRKQTFAAFVDGYLVMEGTSRLSKR